MQKSKLQLKIQNGSLSKLSDSLVSGTQKLLHQAKTEEDLRIGFEKLLEPILKQLNIKSNPRYEKSIYNAGRTDALHGQVVIEYEKPNAFKSPKAINHAYEQLVGYIQGLSKSEKETLFIFESKFIGVGFDGEKIFFVRYKGDETRPKTELKTEDFIKTEPYDFNEASALTLLTHLRALDRIPLTAENLAQKFGSQSELAPKVVSAFVNAFKNWGNQTRIQTFFNEWKRLFGIVYGEQFSGHQEKEAEVLKKLYQVGKDINFQELLFSVHTYFTFLMKLISAELLTLKETSFNSSLSSELAHISDDELKRKLEDIEDGGIYTRKGITNFLEGDFFRWYIDAFDSPELKDVVREIARTLSEFEPATNILAPSATRDLLKKLYQYLVPQEVRHRLGEYYTPDWLAELLLNEVGYDGNTLKRFLDPACGSGTFLVLAIQRAKEHGKKEKWAPLEIAKRIVANIWGFDLNPLAVIAARTNYLFALGDLANELRDLEIPIYLADSVLWPEQIVSQGEFNFHGGDYVKVKTSVKDFLVPNIWIKDKGFLMRQAAPMIEDFVKSGFEPEIAMKHFKKEGLVFPPNEKIVETFYKDILELEKQNRNGIWARFLKNAFAPMTAGKFDFVVGNPPWIRWGYLSKEYRQTTLKLWQSYRLFSSKSARILSGSETDFSMLFVYASADYYLEDKAKLGFLITQEVFKAKGAGEGFRRFQLGEKQHLKVLKAHDLVTVQPFEGAANKTAAIILTKGNKTKYPVPYVIWSKKKGTGKIATDKLLNEVLPLLEKQTLAAQPIGKISGSWQTFSKIQKELTNIQGKNNYKARLGARVEPYGVFWLEVKQVLSEGHLIVRNLSKRGKRSISQVESVVEQSLVFPLISGGNIQRWGISSYVYCLIVNDPSSPMTGYSESLMRERYPRTYSYLLEFKRELLSRALYQKFYQKSEAPFYSQYNIGTYTFAVFKVVWKRMANDLIATVISQQKTSFGYKIIIPTDTTSLFATDNKSEAHYLCAIINSKSVRDFIKSFSSAGRGFGTPSVMEHVGIPKFDPKNPLHQKLSEISKQCHQLKLEGKEKEIEQLERQNDELVKELFKIV
jgi:hypothetical protein